VNPHLPQECPNCASTLFGKFCQACGEKVFDAYDLSVKHFFAHHVIHELTHLDGKIFQTLKLLLLRPGFLSAEYFNGRRQRYITPLRLFLTVCVLFAFVALAQRPQHRSLRGTIAAADPTGLTLRLLEAQAGQTDLASENFRQKFFQKSDAYGTFLSLTAALFVGLVLMAIYSRARAYYVQHLVLALHLVSGLALIFFFFILLEAGLNKIAGPAWALPDTLQAPARLLLFTIMPLGLEALYLFAAFRTFYNSSIAHALVAVPLVVSAMFLLQNLFTVVGFLLALLTL